MATHELLADSPGDVGQRELAHLGGQRGVEHHLEQHVAQLVLDAVGVSRRNRLDRFVGLLDHVAGQRLVRLLGIPRAALAQLADHVGERRHFTADRRGQRGDPD